VIDKSSRDLWREVEHHAPGGYAVVLDANGAETLGQSYRHLAAGGKLVVYGFHGMFRKGRGRPDWIKLAGDYLRTPRFNPLRMTMENRSVLAFNLSFLGDRLDLLQRGMQQLLSWVEEGGITPPATATFALEQVADAQRALEGGQTVGKLVLTMK
jgi:NADPH:quinone reductase-like Zn-dependent oxidoreductase